MPTPSESTPQLTTSTLPGEISAHTTCPPEIERGSSRTAASEEHAIDDDIAVNDGAVSPASATAQTAGRRPSDVTSTPIAESSTKKIKSDEDVIMGSMSPDSASSSETKEEQSSPTSQSSSSISAHSAPSTTSSLSYKFSNSRVSHLFDEVSCPVSNRNSSTRTTLRPFCDPEASLLAPSSPTARYTMWMWKSSMLIWLSHISVDISAYKVGGYQGQMTFISMNAYACSFATRSYGGPSNLDDVLRRGDHRYETYLPDTARVMGSKRKDGYASLGQVSGVAATGEAGEETGLHIQELCAARAYLYEMERVLSSP